jgi:prepilin-type N-terminal cleavage/methylation domain-containing protein
MRADANAFTLAELVVVLAMIGLLTALAVPRFAAMRDSAAVRAAIGETGRTFATAREMAVLRRTGVSVAIDTARDRLELRSLGAVLLRRDLGVTYGVMLVTNRDSMVYDARGLGYGASNLTLVLRRGGVADTFTVSRLGRTRW